MIGTVVEPEIASGHTSLGRWKVVIFDNDTNSMEEVVLVLIEATGCTAEEAQIEMWEAHTFGKANVHFAKRPECERVAGIISRIGVKTEVSEEWAEE